MVRSRRLFSVGFGVVALLLAGDARAQQPDPPPQAPQQPPQTQPAQPSQPQPAAQAQPATNLYIFNSDAGAILNFIKPDKTSDYEAVMAKVREALMKSEKPERKQQAAGWRIFKAAEGGPNGSTIYVSLMDPAAKGSDYQIGTLLVEAFGNEEGRRIYDMYSTAYGTPAQNILHLTLVADLGK
jgi:hypothetical protein